MPSTVSTSIVRGARRRIATRPPKPSAKRYATGPEEPGPSKPAATTTETASVIASASSPSTTRGRTPASRGLPGGRALTCGQRTEPRTPRHRPQVSGSCRPRATPPVAGLRRRPTTGGRCGARRRLGIVGGMNPHAPGSPAPPRPSTDRLSWPTVLGLGAMALLWPLTALTGLGGDGAPRALAVLGLTALVWVGVVGLGRVARPVLTLTLA